jgi:hypothetical protein
VRVNQDLEIVENRPGAIAIGNKALAFADVGLAVGLELADEI